MTGEEILREHGDRVWRLVRRMVGDEEARKDLFQECILEILRSVPRFEGRAKLSTWIHSVTLRTCYRHYRRLRRDRALTFGEWMEEEVEATVASPVPERLGGAGAREAIDRALSALPPKQRVPIHLRYVEERRYKEIADSLGAPVGTVKTNIYRGLKRMRELIGGSLDDHL